MPRRIGELTETGIIAEMRAELRRLWRAVGSNQAPVGEYNEYTLASSSDSAHTLTYIPSLSLIPIACLNGLPGRYGTDYTVDFTTGIVTWSATKVAGDILSVFYQTTGDLVALSSTVDLGAFVDTFNRADSTTTLGTTSDGRATWTTTSTNNVPWGITSNTAQAITGLGEDAQAYIDGGSADGIVQVTLAALDNNTGVRFAGPMFRWSDHVNYWFIECKDIAGVSQVVKKVANSKIQLGSPFTTTVGDTVTVTLSAGSVSVAVNGTTVSTVSDSFNQTATKHGMYAETGATHFDNWSFSPS